MNDEAIAVWSEVNRSTEINRAGLLPQKLTEILGDPLNHRVNWVDTFVTSLDRVPREEIENQKTGVLIVVSSLGQVLVAFFNH